MGLGVALKSSHLAQPLIFEFPNGRGLPLKLRIQTCIAECNQKKPESFQSPIPDVKRLRPTGAQPSPIFLLRLPTPTASVHSPSGDQSTLVDYCMSGTVQGLVNVSERQKE